MKHILQAKLLDVNGPLSEIVFGFPFALCEWTLKNTDSHRHRVCCRCDDGREVRARRLRRAGAGTLHLVRAAQQARHGHAILGRGQGRYPYLLMAHFHCRTRIQIRTQTRIPKPMAT